MGVAKSSTIAVDTNILVYAFDSAEPKKRKAAKALFESIFRGEKHGVVTNQILAEFAHVVTKRVKHPLTNEQTAAIMSTILSSANWTTYNYTGETVLASLTSSQPRWDALLAQTLKEHGVQALYTENAKDFTGSGLAVHNPLRS